MTSPETTTQLLLAWGAGDRSALDRMLPLVYEELRRIAVSRLRRERPGHTLQPTALVHEAYMRLVDQRQVDWRNRAQFLGLAAEMMRRILVNHARDRRASKRGGADVRVTLEDGIAAAAAPDPDLVALDDALRTLAEVDPRKAQIVELRYFGGLTTKEVAEVTGVSVATVERDWTTARTWLHRALSKGSSA
jgi:RNA polymerase sigma factor (TIGR02999 family)